MFKFYKSRHLVLFGLLAMAVFICSCSTPTQQISNFGRACASIGTDSQKAYVFLDESIQKKQIYNTALHPESHIPITGKSAMFDELMQDRQRLALRTKLLAELGDYAQTLQRLADKNFRADIDKSSKDLAGALKSMKNTYEKSAPGGFKLSDQEIFGVATAVDAAGSAYFEWERRADIKKIVSQADPAVQQVTALLAKEFQDIGPVVERELNQVETDYEKAFNTGAANMSFEARLEMLQNIQVAHYNNINSGKLYTNLVTAIIKIGETHAALKQALDNNDWTSKNLFDQVQELSACAQSVNSFYQSLK